MAYVTHEDICKCFKDDTLLAVQAPSGTQLEVPIPDAVNKTVFMTIALMSFMCHNAVCLFVQDNLCVVVLGILLLLTILLISVQQR